MRIGRIARAISAVALGTLITSPSEASTSTIPRSAFPGVQSLESTELRVMAGVDAEALIAEDTERERSGIPAPARYAIGLPVAYTPGNSGTWETLEDGTRLWRLRISSPGAQTLSLGMEIFDLPANATFWVHDPKGAWVQGPYASQSRNSRGGLWTAVVLGDEIVAELHVRNMTTEPFLTITSVNHGYRGFAQQGGEKTAKRGTCNVNVVCPEGNRFGDQIRAIARITISGGGGSYLCSGQLINNTAEDDNPYLLTAGHCMYDEVGNSLDPSTLVAYWNYETVTCDEFFGGSLSQNQSGATLMAESYGSDFDFRNDFALLALDDVPDPSFDVYYLGWDARDIAPQSTVCVHHPDGDQKSISFDFDPATITSIREDSSPGSGDYLRVADWDIGTTEPGSSGSCLLGEASGLYVGSLTDGAAACGNDLSDWFSRMNRQFTGEGTPETRLSDWLDPLGTGAEFLFGKNPGTKSASQTWLIPSVASLLGAEGSDWKSQISLVNASTTSRNAMVYFVPNKEDWPGELLSGPHLIGPMGSLYLDDPLLPENPTSGVMYVTVDGDRTAGFSRTINLSDGGATFGQGVPGILLNDASLTTELVLPMVHSSPGRYRTNVGFAQTSAGPFRVLVSIYSSESVLLAEHSYGINKAWWQVNDIFGKLGIGDLDVEGGWIRVTLTGGAPAFWTTYATVIDNTTNDPTYILPVAP